jgi:hypothetical protein
MFVCLVIVRQLEISSTDMALTKIKRMLWIVGVLSIKKDQPLLPGEFEMSSAQAFPYSEHHQSRV